MLYVGNIKPHKNLVRLIEAFSQLRRTHDDLKLLIIGDEISKLPALRRAVHRHKLHKHVRFLGYLKDDTLTVLYRLASVFVFPSLYEGFGLPPLEAMASGTPVVTSNVSSLPEVTGDAAVLVDPYDVESIGDGMRRILDDPRLAEELRAEGTQARARVLVGTLGREDAARLSGGCRRRARRRDGAPGRVSGPRVALVHDWLTGMRGGEKVLEALCEIYPDADIFTLVHRKGSVSPAIERHPIRTSLVQYLPLATTKYPQYLPLFPFAIEQLQPRRLRPGDQLESLRREERHRARARRAPLLLPFADAVCVGSVRRLLRPGARRAGRRADGCTGRCCRDWRGGMPSTSGRVHRFVANSAHVAARIRRYYNREATIVYPPVDTVFYHPADVAPESHFLIVSALVPYKRIDLAIAACEQHGSVASHRRRRSRAEAPGAARRTRRDVPRLAVERGDSRRVSPRRRGRSCPARKTSASCRSRLRPAAARPSPGARRRARDGEGRRDRRSVRRAIESASLTAALERARAIPFDRSVLRRHAEQFARERYIQQMRAVVDDDAGRARRHTMVRRYNRLLVAFYVVGDAVLAMWAFILAYGIRFESGLIPVFRGYPPFEQYLQPAAVHCRPDAARVPRPGRLPAAARTLARRRLLLRPRRQHPRRRLRRRLDVVRAGVLGVGRGARHAARTRSRRSSGGSSSCSPSCSRTRCASSSASCSSAAGEPASG